MSLICTEMGLGPFNINPDPCHLRAEGCFSGSFSRVGRRVSVFLFLHQTIFAVTFTLSIRDSILYYLKNQDFFLTDFLEKIMRNSFNLEECSKAEICC